MVGIGRNAAGQTARPERKRGTSRIPTASELYHSSLYISSRSVQVALCSHISTLPPPTANPQSTIETNPSIDAISKTNNLSRLAKAILYYGGHEWVSICCCCCYFSFFLFTKCFDTKINGNESSGIVQPIKPNTHYKSIYSTSNAFLSSFFLSCIPILSST